MPTKMRSFEADEEQYNLFKSILAKEGVDLGDKLNEFIKTFNKDHGDGNPHSTIDQFTENENFLVTPAIFRDGESIRKYLEKIYGTPEWGKLGSQIQKVWVNQYNDVEASHL